VWCLSGIALIHIVEPKVMDAEYRASLNPIVCSQVRTDPTSVPCHIPAGSLRKFDNLGLIVEEQRRCSASIPSKRLMASKSCTSFFGCPISAL
jgi:hypothetical protein